MAKEHRAAARELAAYLRALASDIDTGRWDASGTITQELPPDDLESTHEHLTLCVSGYRERAKP